MPFWATSTPSICTLRPSGLFTKACTYICGWVASGEEVLWAGVVRQRVIYTAAQCQIISWRAAMPNCLGSTARHPEAPDPAHLRIWPPSLIDDAQSLPTKQVLCLKWNLGCNWSPTKAKQNTGQQANGKRRGVGKKLELFCAEGKCILFVQLYYVYVPLCRLCK